MVRPDSAVVLAMSTVTVVLVACACVLGAATVPPSAIGEVVSNAGVGINQVTVSPYLRIFSMSRKFCQKSMKLL